MQLQSIFLKNNWAKREPSTPRPIDYSKHRMFWEHMGFNTDLFSTGEVQTVISNLKTNRRVRPPLQNGTWATAADVHIKLHSLT